MRRSRLEQIYSLIQDGIVGPTVVTALDLGSPELVHECELVDYKREFDSSGSGIAKTVRDIVAFHNTYGGYIVFGVEEKRKDEEYELSGSANEIDLQKLRGAIDKYTGANINIRVSAVQCMGVDLSLLYIPKSSDKPVSFIADKQDEKNRAIFTRSETVLRDGDRVRTARNADDWELLRSSRSYPPASILSGYSKPQRIIHNLPDKNLICPDFVGRVEIVAALWAWLADEFEYVKVLAGEGGRGKTSIAYEFAKQVITASDPDFEAVVWLTAKQKQFVALRDEYQALPEVHFTSPESLLSSVIRELALQPVESEASLPSLKRDAVRVLADTPTLLIVDDIDSLEVEEQRQAIDILRQVTGGRSTSRALVTTRSNVSMPSDQCIEVPGFPFSEFEEYVNRLTSRFGLSELRPGEMKRLHKVSDGSPMFTESILRLVISGLQINQAVERWSGEEGETVRSAALRREIEQLKPESRRILYALALVESASLTELRQITQYEENVLAKAIDQLSSLFLVHSPRIVESERRFEVPASTGRLIIKLAPEIVNRPDQIEKGVKRALQKIPKRSGEIGRAIRQALALAKEEQWKDAHATVDALLNRTAFKNHPDLLLLRARVCKSEGNLDRARNVLKQAYDQGCRKSLLFEIWFEAETASNHYQGMLDVCELVLLDANDRDVEGKWTYRRAESIVRRAIATSDYEDRMSLLVRAAEELAMLVRVTDGPKCHQYRADIQNLHDLIWETAAKKQDWRRAVREAISALDRGDARLNLYERILDGLIRQSSIGAKDSQRWRRQQIAAVEKRLESRGAGSGGSKNRSMLLERLRGLAAASGD